LEAWHPEIVMFGVPMSHVNEVSDLVYNRLLDGDPLPVGREHRHRVPADPWLRSSTYHPTGSGVIQGVLPAGSIISDNASTVVLPCCKRSGVIETT
jgi:hypothetical protein